ncbi:MAG: TrkA C-terminal domain-containing protein [Clostridia bacterium]|nr:TrkA C-terminal domain-containing protein [Clostridia bacterium]
MSLILFAVIFVFLWLVVEIVSILFKSTGMDLYKARFQTISILTHTGFTTRESELITQHPARRKIASGLMVVSYLTQITLISVLINVLISDTNAMLSVGVILFVLLVFIFLITRTRFLSSRFNSFVERIVEKRINKSTKKNPMSQVMKISPEFGIYEIVVGEDGGLAGKTLMESHLKEAYVQVLKVDKGSETINFPHSSLMLRVGDKLVVYGKIKSIKDIIVNQ